MASPLRRCALRLRAFREAPDPTIDTHRAYTRGTVEYVTFPTGRITGLQSADCIEMIEIHDGGGEIETRVRESCCTVAHVYSSYESDAARLRSAPYTAVLIRMGPIAQGGGRERTPSPKRYPEVASIAR